MAVQSASLALAEDFKTINGKIYKDATISRVEADGIVLRTKTGISKVYFIELPKDIQDRFHWLYRARTAEAVVRKLFAMHVVNGEPPLPSYADSPHCPH